MKHQQVFSCWLFCVNSMMFWIGPSSESAMCVFICRAWMNGKWRYADHDQRIGNIASQVKCRLPVTVHCVTLWLRPDYYPTLPCQMRQLTCALDFHRCLRRARLASLQVVGSEPYYHACVMHQFNMYYNFWKHVSSLTLASASLFYNAPGQRGWGGGDTSPTYWN